MAQQQRTNAEDAEKQFPPLRSPVFLRGLCVGLLLFRVILPPDGFMNHPD
jgi:hypothetical protein